MTALPPTLPGTTTAPVRWQPGPDLLVEGDRYRLRVRGGASSLPARPFAELEDRTGRRWLQICLLAGADGESRDETWEICSATAEPDGDDLSSHSSSAARSGTDGWWSCAAGPPASS